MKFVHSALIKKEPKLKDDNEEVSSMSEGSSNKELGICFHECTTKKQGKTCNKSRRFVVCQKLTVVYCNCCTKDYCCAVGVNKHDRTCLEDNIKNMKKNNRFRRIRSHVV